MHMCMCAKLVQLGGFVLLKTKREFCIKWKYHKRILQIYLKKKIAHQNVWNNCIQDIGHLAIKTHYFHRHETK